MYVLKEIVTLEEKNEDIFVQKLIFFRLKKCERLIFQKWDDFILFECDSGCFNAMQMFRKYQCRYWKWILI